MTSVEQESKHRPEFGPGHVGTADMGPGLATIDRRPNRPGFHHQGPLGGHPRPFARRRFRHPPSGMQNVQQGRIERMSLLEKKHDVKSIKASRSVINIK